jgi:hypothetical protein
MRIPANPRRLALRAASLAALLMAISPCARAADTAHTATKLVAGSTLESLAAGKVTYKQVRVRTISAQTAMIQHEGGIASVRLSELSPELQQRFGYNPDAAAAEAEKQKAAAFAAEQKRKLQLEAQKKALASRVTPEPPPSSRVETTVDQLLQRLGQPAEIKDRVDLRPRYNQLGLWIKNQGMRPSCAVFAIVSSLEFQSAEITGKAERFSEEYLLWATYKILNRKPRPVPEQLTSRDKIPDTLEERDEGFLLSEVVTALRTYGVVPRARMPNRVWAGPDDNLEPEESIIQEARATRRVAIHAIPGRDPEAVIANIIHALNAGVPVAIGLFWPDFVSPQSGFLDRQVPTKDYGHAVTLVGYKSDRGTLEDAVFTFKNSYGTEWGIDGYGTVTYRYLAENLNTAVVLEVQSQ